jgi:hypothetical protein
VDYGGTLDQTSSYEPAVNLFKTPNQIPVVSNLAATLRNNLKFKIPKSHHYSNYALVDLNVSKTVPQL